MSRLHIDEQSGRIVFWCPGCDRAHGISVQPGRWTFNGDPLKPTFSPSVLSFHVHPETGERVHDCHSFVRDGMIQFLNDCTHPLAGQTVELPGFDDSLNRWANKEHA